MPDMEETMLRSFSSRMWKIVWDDLKIVSQVFSGVLILMGTLCAQMPGGESGEANKLYEEGQRYHLGVDRPVDLRKAYQYYQKAVELDPKLLDAFYNLANIYFVQKRFDLAEKAYARVIVQNPKDADAYNNLGVIYYRQGKPDKAREYYRRALKINPELGQAY